VFKVSTWLIAAFSLSLSLASAAPGNNPTNPTLNQNVAAETAAQKNPVPPPLKAATPVQSPPPAATSAPAQAPEVPTTAPTTNPPQSQQAATTTPFINNQYVLTGSLKVNGYHPDDPTMVIVDKGSHSTYVLQLQNNQVTRVLTVSNAIGKEEKPTPPGRYYVLSKKQFPTWIPPKTIDKKQKPVPPYNETHKNPLGVAAIFLNKDELALHGTNDPREIRQSASHGCVRHSNSDISKVYGMVHKGDTVLIISEFRGTVLNKSDFKSRQAQAGNKAKTTDHKSKSK